ncbi:MAG: 16S rRNA (cytosine(1402)-N(4))-methyltransferase RsmH [Candidatus Omnitrophota bacterium]
METTSLFSRTSPSSLWKLEEMVKPEIHKPVMCDEVLEYLKLSPGMTVVDCTVGCGGHAAKILERILPAGRLVGIDRDGESLEVARDRLSAASCGAVSLIHGNFRDLDKILSMVNIGKADAIFFDLGLSSVQLLNPERGFSFQSDGPLDMRMDRTSFIQAYDLINNLNEEELSSILWSFGQEKFHNRIARLLVGEREKAPINSTSQIANIVIRAMPRHYKFGRIHPATRTFQAIRIAVNRELEALEEGLQKAIDLLAPHGRIAAISFHSLEDRIVKVNFRSARAEGKLQILTPKPRRPTEVERADNPSSRSARFRAAEKISPENNTREK